MFTEDLSIFFNTDDFAVTATWKSTDSVNVIFDKAYLDQQGIIASNTPIAKAQESDFAGVAEGDELLINGVNYTIDNFEPDGTGIIVLILKKAS
jgi:hypothetical protein